MVWRYVAINGLAYEVCGFEMGSRHEVLARLKSQGLMPVSLEADVLSSLKGALSGGAIPSDKLSFFFRDFANMLSAGIALNHILLTFKDSILDARLMGACSKISEELVAGKSLAQAMESTKVFPRLALHAVRAGEKAGHMPTVMGLLADHFQLSGELKGKCLGALIYPSCVLCFLFVALIYVSQVVVPQLAPLLPSEAMNEPLTRAMLALSTGVRFGWVPLLGFIGMISVALALFIRRKPRLWDEFLVRNPFFGPVRRDLQVSVCFFNLYILLKSGIPLDTALGETASSVDELTGFQIGQAREYLAAGHTFSAALAEIGYFPRLVVETIRLGEEMGRYDDYCERVFKLYYRSFETRVGMLVAALQPLMLSVCALFVMAMALAFLKPIYANLTQIGVINRGRAYCDPRRSCGSRRRDDGQMPCSA
jgi:type II secretory pathway component PulF